MEQLKWMAAGLILVSSAWVGLHAALRLRRTGEELQELHGALDRMTGEIRYAGTPFAPLCKRLAESSSGSVRHFFQGLAAGTEHGAGCGLTRRIAQEVGLTLPNSALSVLERLFDDFGNRDLEAQLSQLCLAQEELSRLETELRVLMPGKCRSYEVLGIVTGLSLLILVL